MKRASLFSLLVSVLLLVQSPVHAQSPADRQRKLESSVLHKAASLQDVRVYSRAQQKWLPLPPSAAKVRVVNLWARTCAPCLAELPSLTKAVEQVKRQHGSVVQFLFIADPMEQTSAQEVVAFWASPWADTLSGKDRCTGLDSFRGEVPSCLLTVPDVDPARSESARLQLLLGSDDSRPVTLLLDQQGVVRQAFVGSFGKSTNELIQAIEHLLAAVSGRPITRSP